MAVKKQSGSSTPRKSSRSAKPQNVIDNQERNAGLNVSTADMASGTAENAVIEGNAIIDLDDVRRRAYELYEERGRAEGHHEDDWYRAEQEVRARNSSKQIEIPPRKKSA